MTARIITGEECHQRRHSGPFAAPMARPAGRGHLATALVFLAIGWGVGVLCGLAA